MWGLLSEKKALGSLASGNKTAWELPGLSWRRLGAGVHPPQRALKRVSRQVELLRKEGMAETRASRVDIGLTPPLLDTPQQT